MKPVLCIFAHPDDEAFGPGGTIALLAKKHPVYLICITDGNDQNHGKTDLAKKRKQELRLSAKILGIKKVFFLNYPDGSLNNNLYHQLAKRLQGFIDRLQPETLITFEPRGVSGHIDHVTVSLVTSYVFSQNAQVKTLLYFCIDQRQRRLIKEYFIYFPSGYALNRVDKVVNIARVWQQKVTAIQQHQTQAQDIQRILAMLEKLPKEEYFLVLKK